MPKLHVVAVSTRPNRAGFPVAQWFFERAKAHAKFEVTLVDLQQVNLPLFDEPEHPRLKKYTHEHTKRWSATVEAADAFVFVAPEYNYTSAPSYVNALDYVFHEWAYKPVSYVSYGGGVGGARAVQTMRLQAMTLKMVPIPEAVHVPMFMQLIKDGKFTPNDAIEKSAGAVLDELFKLNGALEPLRAKKPA
ncbi:MAG: NAD(P)H-dependent oxidoreductase [Myxococcaceae bacterium]|nr:NAD(P)H-dependent oxidoreductase [Myxococcaceae bacterium]